MRINNKKLKNRKKLLLDFVSNKEYQPMRAKDDFFFSIPLSPFLSFFGIV